MTAEELRPICGCEQGMGHMDPGCHSYGLCHAQSAERATHPRRLAPAANPRRLAWFTDDELVAELERRAPGKGGAEEAVRRVEALCWQMDAWREGDAFAETPTDVTHMWSASLRAALAPQAGDGAR